MSDIDVTGTDYNGDWDPRMRASIEMTEQLATVIQEDVQELRKELRQLAAGLEELVKNLINKETKSGE